MSSGDDKLLFTPGPLTTSSTVKRAMLHDAGSRDERFLDLVREVRERLLGLGGVSKEAGYEAVLMQGSGTFGVESVISSIIPADGKILVLINGAYGERIRLIAERLKIGAEVLRWPEDEAVDPEAVAKVLEAGQVGYVVVVHCETTTGILNPVEAVGRLVEAAGGTLIVDAMSSFGAIPLDLAAAGVGFLISSANKCIEGVPGFSFVLGRRDQLVASRGRARSLSLDLLAQWEGLERNGQFRFTPPTHALLAFHQALDELDAEGGVAGRGRRYRANHETLLQGMRELGFRPYLAPELQSCVITAFRYPKDARFDFEAFYQRLGSKGMIIYPGKLSEVDCFRIGSIGRLRVEDMRALLLAIREVLGEMGVRVPVESDG